MRWISAAFLSAAAVACAPAPGEEPSEKTRQLCDPSDPRMQCPGASCICVDDTLEITFDGDSQSVLEYDAFTQDMPIEVIVVSETVSEHVQGWSYGVAHDEQAMLFWGYASWEGTDARAFCKGSCDESASGVNIETCLDAECMTRAPGGGWVQAVVLSFTMPVELPIKRNTLARAVYRLKKDVGPGGTLIQVTDRLAKKGSPPQAVSLAVDGRTRRWSTTVDGWVKQRGSAETPFVRGDADGNGKINIADGVLIIQRILGNVPPGIQCDDALDADDDGELSIGDSMPVFQYIFAKGPALPAPFPDCGPDPTSDANACGVSKCPPVP